MKYNEIFESVPSSTDFIKMFKVMMKTQKSTYMMDGGKLSGGYLAGKLQDVYRIEFNEAKDVWDAVIDTLVKQYAPNLQYHQKIVNLATWKNHRLKTELSSNSLDAAIDNNNKNADPEMTERTIRMAYSQLLKAGKKALQ